LTKSQINLPHGDRQNETTNKMTWICR